MLAPPAEAVIVAVFVAVTAEAVAVKPAVVELAGTDTVAGTVREEVLLLRLTVTALVVEAELSVTVQESVPLPVIEESAQVRPESVGEVAAGLSWTAKVLVAPPADPVMVAVWVVETAEAVAVKLTLVELAGTDTVAGTVSDELLLLRFTVTAPLVEAALRVAVQESVPLPVIEDFEQVNAESDGAAVAVGFT